MIPKKIKAKSLIIGDRLWDDIVIHKRKKEVSFPRSLHQNILGELYITLVAWHKCDKHVVRVKARDITEKRVKLHIELEV